jgi:hypothetical protein
LAGHGPARSPGSYARHWHLLQAASSKLMIIEAVRHFPVRVRVAVPAQQLWGALQSAIRPPFSLADSLTHIVGSGLNRLRAIVSLFMLFALAGNAAAQPPPGADPNSPMGLRW